ncbi:transcriptional regulator [Microlunatus ginsengisoli]|uniref:Transcriptional regulator n=1 Tax=Microlunatus ginsengisoli TaxID=363863 RepID=A0ABP6ZG69_9ACTN
MPVDSPADLLTLHAVRIRGMADDREVAQRFGLDPGLVAELLLDYQAYGWISRVDFAGTGGWTLTRTGFEQNRRRLSAELDDTGAGAAVRAGYRAFQSRNTRLQRACTDWQLRPTAADPLAVNDHFDATWDRPVIDALDLLDAELVDIVTTLAGALSRFAGYDVRFDAALARVQSGDPAWVTGVGIDSCHTVWMELHEDLLATLGLERGEPMS